MSISAEAVNSTVAKPAPNVRAASILSSSALGIGLPVLTCSACFSSTAGTSVSRDFVELPSQLYEHWLTVPATDGQVTSVSMPCSAWPN